MKTIQQLLAEAVAEFRDGFRWTTEVCGASREQLLARVMRDGSAPSVIHFDSELKEFENLPCLPLRADDRFHDGVITGPDYGCVLFGPEAPTQLLMPKVHISDIYAMGGEYLFGPRDLADDLSNTIYAGIDEWLDEGRTVVIRHGEVFPLQRKLREFILVGITWEGCAFRPGKDNIEDFRRVIE